MIFIEKVRLIDFLNNSCPYKGCYYNDGYGICDCSDEGFQQYIQGIREYEHKRHNKIRNTIYFTCNKIDVDEGFCEYCGHKLIESHTRVPYGEGHTYKKDVFCPHCS